ncbi:hypothetical protein [Clostridium cylindrosporum]|uniref:Uncharacterized protein n=1 Tax=Clostridium cylindrosporum DSM 605 TaxID=1121307 RepID=A0A0J8D6T8_CLOCY|nr:hypothetical protein [Clostridium cylindrosporum]KMT21572.1 hypothetical protein CLCY_2c03340 [Clostridium cylindrosporum DSM 605]
MEAILDRLHDEWLEDDKEYPRIEAICYECGNEIYIYEDHYEIEGFTVCEDCLIEFASKRYLIRGEC